MDNSHSINWTYLKELTDNSEQLSVRFAKEAAYAAELLKMLVGRTVEFLDSEPGKEKAYLNYGVVEEIVGEHYDTAWLDYPRLRVQCELLSVSKVIKVQQIRMVIG